LNPGGLVLETNPPAKMPEKVVYFPCNPETFDGMTAFPVTLPAKKAMIRSKIYGSAPRFPASLGAEVDEALKEWYGARGLPVPAEEVGIGAVIDAAEAAETGRIEAAWAKAEEEMPSVVPEYGTPEFWAYHRAKKAAENARRAAEGLPPLPTKKELEAEKAKRKAEREAKKAAAAALKAARAQQKSSAQ
jgi:hypothetical protein